MLIFILINMNVCPFQKIIWLIVALFIENVTANYRDYIEFVCSSSSREVAVAVALHYLVENSLRKSLNGKKIEINVALLFLASFLLFLKASLIPFFYRQLPVSLELQESSWRIWYPSMLWLVSLRRKRSSPKLVCHSCIVYHYICSPCRI